MLALPGVGRAAFATPLDQQWTLSSWEHEMRFSLSFQGKLYVLHTPLGEEDVHQVLRIDPPVQQDGAGGGRALLLSNLLLRTRGSTRGRCRRRKGSSAVAL